MVRNRKNTQTNYAKMIKLRNNLTICRKVYIYNLSKRVYYCIHVDRKGALDGFFAISSYEYKGNSIEEERLNKLSDDQFIQPGICVETSQILMIAEQNRSIPSENF